MGRFFGILLLTLSFMVAAILIVPGLINWNAYRQEIVSYAERVSGRHVTIGGDISLKLLPQPSLVLGDFAIAKGKEAGGPPLVRLDRLELQADLRSLFAGRLQVTNLLLVAPMLDADALWDQNGNWLIKRAEPAEQEENGAASDRGQFLANAVRFDNAEIKNGTLVFHTKSGVEERVTKLDGTLSAQSLYGPVAAKGSASYHGVDFDFDVNAGDMTYKRAVPLSVVARLHSSDTALAFHGSLDEASFSGPYHGEISATGGNGEAALQDILSLMQEDRAAPLAPGASVPDVPFDVKTELAVTGDAFSTGNLTLQLNGARFTGTLTGTRGAVPNFNLALKAETVQAGQRAPDGQSTEQTPWQALSGWRPARASGANAEKAGFLLPDNWVGSFAVDVEGLSVHGGLIRDIHAAGVVRKGEIVLQEGVARLPGAADLRLTGLWSPAKGGAQFQGDIALRSESPFRTLAWAGLSTDSLNGGLSVLDLKGRLTVAPGTWALEQANLTGGDQKITGSYRETVGAENVIGLRLQSRDLNLDFWGGLVGEKDLTPSRLWHLPDGLALDLDVDVSSLHFAATRLKDVRLQGRFSDGAMALQTCRFEDSSGAVTALKGDFEGGWINPRADLSGSIKANSALNVLQTVGLPGAVLHFDGPLSVTFALKSDADKSLNGQLAGTIAAAGQAPLNLSAKLSGKEGVYDLDLKGQGTGVSLTAEGNIIGRQSGLIYDLELGAKAGSWDGLLHSFGHDAEADHPPTDSISLSANVKGDGDSLRFSNILGTAGKGRLSGDVTVKFPEQPEAKQNDSESEKPDLDARIDLHDLDMSAFWPNAATGPVSSAVATPKDVSVLSEILQSDAQKRFALLPLLMKFTGKVELSAQNATLGGVPFDRLDVETALEPDRLVTKSLDGTLFGGALTGDFTYSVAGLTPELKGSFDLKNADLGGLSARMARRAPDHAPVAGTVDLTAAISALGSTRTALMASLAGTGSVSADAGVFRGFDANALGSGLDKVAELDDFHKLAQKTLTSGATPFRGLHGAFSIEEGKVALSKADSPGAAEADLTAAATPDSKTTGHVIFAGEIDLPAEVINLESRISLAARAKAPPVVLRIVGPLAAPEAQVNSAAMGSFLVDEFATRATNREKTETERQIEMFQKGIKSLENGAAQ